MRRNQWRIESARPAAERILDRIVVDENQCWVWPGATRGRGEHRYGCIRTGSRIDNSRRIMSTHVVMWEWAYGPVPHGLELDHLCRNTLCCFPDHLEPVTHRENSRRMVLGLDELQRRREHMQRINDLRYAGRP